MQKKKLWSIIVVFCLILSAAAGVVLPRIFAANVVCQKCGSTNVRENHDSENINYPCGGTTAFICNECDTHFLETLPIHHGNIRLETTMALPTCTEPGYGSYMCMDCDGAVEGGMYEGEIPALGHLWDDGVVTKTPTCTEAGTKLYTCTRNASDAAAIPCGQTKTESIPATGHSWSGWTQTKAPTCTEKGTEERTCATCGGKETRSIDPKGHTAGTPATTEATCTEDGGTLTKCTVCGEVLDGTVIPATGHNFPEEWTVTKEATETEDGEESKTCSVCGAVQTQVIPRTGSEEPEPAQEPEKKGLPLPAVLGLSLAAAAIAFLVIKTVGAAKTVKAAKQASSLGTAVGAAAAGAGAAVVAKNFIPDFSRKYVYNLLNRTGFGEKLSDELRGKRYIKYSEGDREEKPDDIPANVKEEAPDLILLDLNEKYGIDDNLNLIEDIKKKYTKALYAFVVDDSMKECIPQLEELQEEGKIKTFITSDIHPMDGFIKLILPLYKPVIDAESTLDNVGKISDKLGIPYVSTIISIFQNGSDIKEALSEEKYSFGTAKTVIASIADVMGWDNVTDLSDIIDDVSDKKDLVQEELDREKLIREAEEAKTQKTEENSTENEK